MLRKDEPPASVLPKKHCSSRVFSTTEDSRVRLPSVQRSASSSPSKLSTGIDLKQIKLSSSVSTRRAGSSRSGVSDKQSYPGKKRTIDPKNINSQTSSDSEQKFQNSVETKLREKKFISKPKLPKYRTKTAQPTVFATYNKFDGSSLSELNRHKAPDRQKLSRQLLKNESAKEEKENSKKRNKYFLSQQLYLSISRERKNTGGTLLSKHKLEESWIFEKDVMWAAYPNGKRAGFLLFCASNLDGALEDSTGSKYQITFKFSQADSKLIRLLMETHGLTEVPSNSDNFNLHWSNAHFNPNEIRHLFEWQRLNHFPRSSELTRKDRLYVNIKRMQHQYGVKLFDFVPTSFILPTEYREFCDTFLREKGTWIIKPVASSQGKGIYLISQIDQVPTDEISLISRYIESPLLVDGYKCDLRLYITMTSLDPMVVYLYEEGIVRLATVKYQHGKNLWNPCIHLTNYSVNKFHSNYIQNEDADLDDKGNKWSLSAFLRHLKGQGVDTGILMRNIEDVIIKSILSASYQMSMATNMFVPFHHNCFELYGFDILIDSQLKPWVLEVNLSPSLNIDQPLDLKIKSTMLADLFSLVGVPVCNPYTTKCSNKSPLYRKLPNLRCSSDYKSHFSKNGGAVVPSLEEAKIIRHICEEYQRRGGWARIYPTPDSWTLYGGLQDSSSSLNLVLHHYLYPHIPKNVRYGRVMPMRLSCVSSSGLASSLERLACYERALPRGLACLKDHLKSGPFKKSERKVSRDLQEVKLKLKESLENGMTLSKYQARMAFSVYLQHIQRRLMVGCDQDRQVDLVCRFLRSATRTLHLPLNVQTPSKTLPSEARAVVISKQLGDFIQAYTKETHLYLSQESSASCSSLSSQCPNSSVATPDSTKTLPLPGESSSLSSSVTSSSVQTSISESTDEGIGDLSTSRKIFSKVKSLKQTSFDSAIYGSSLSLQESVKPKVSRVSGVGSERSTSSVSLTPDTKGSKSDSDSDIFMKDTKCKSLNYLQDSNKQDFSENGITMDLYRAFISIARESDLEEVLSLQTKLHNTAGVFLDPARRSLSSSQHHHQINTSFPVSKSASLPSRYRTPSPSPHSSPRKTKAVKGTVPEPIVSEPSSIISIPDSERKAASLPPTYEKKTFSSCCTIGSILKASLKGTNTTFSC